MDISDNDLEPKVRRIISILESMDIEQIIRYQRHLGMLQLKEAYERGLLLHYVLCSDIIRLKSTIEVEKLRKIEGG